MGWTRWRAPADDDIDGVLPGNKTEVKDRLKMHELTTGYQIGASE
jgi:hypothetical protein